MQGYTGAIDVINESVYHYLKDMTDEKLQSSTVDILAKRGYLTERSADEERQHVKKVAGIFYRRSSQYLSFVIAPTFSCQMRCTYCFESHTSHRDDDTPLKTRTSEHVKGVYAAIDKLVEGKGGNKNKALSRITLYGGEPLIAENHQIVREIVEGAIDRKYSLEAITNGYDLVKYEDLLGPGKIDLLQVTLDGPEAVHNKRRFAKNGLPTFKNIVEGIQLALDKGCQISLRTNVDFNNMNSLAELNRFYIEKGWNKNKNFNPYAFIIKERSQSLILPMELLTSLDGIYSKAGDALANNIIHVDFGVRSCFSNLISSKKIPSLRSYFCGSSLASYIFGPDGNIYTCWEEVGLEEGILGRYMPELVWNDKRVDEWHKRTVDNIPECLDCPYALICGGGCARQAKLVNGSLLSPYCHQFPEAFQFLVPTLYETYLKSAKEMKESNDAKVSDTCN